MRRRELGDRLESSSSVLIYPSGIFSPAYDIKIIVPNHPGNA
jgi:hypothetical protein